MSADIVELLIRDRIAVITLNRPQQRNALSIEMRAMLARRLDEIDEHVRVIVLQGAGAAFCAGADLGELGGATFSGGSELGGESLSDVVWRF